ncbi:MAG: GNAT family N-acetyltransferase [Clostridium celatum]|nr:GNAT family N-acetyltransferase [Clostridium celatum]
MKFIRLLSKDDKMFNDAMILYKKSFPCHEQRGMESQIEILNDKEYHFDLIYDNNSFVGIILYWETLNYIYIEHFCIEPNMRNKKYGENALELLKKRKKTIILEIDPPIDEISIRRKLFYTRAGYKENDFNHIHPPYSKYNKGHLLSVMSYPDFLTQIEYDNFNLYLENRVMKV